MLGYKPFDELKVSVRGLTAHITRLRFFSQHLPLLRRGLEAFPAVHPFCDVLPQQTVPAFESNADLILDAVLSFLPTNILAHDEGTIA